MRPLQGITNQGRDSCHGRYFTCAIGLPFTMNNQTILIITHYLEDPPMQSSPAQWAMLAILIGSTGAGQAAEEMLAFVGKKISVAPLERSDSEKSGVFTEALPDGGTRIALVQYDPAVQAEYRIVQLVAGTYAQERISFAAYDHMGHFGFANHAHVLLFVQRDKGRWVQKKYQFFPVFQLHSGEWAACGTADATLAARSLEFGQDAFFTVDEGNASRFAEPYFEQRDGRAFCKLGNTVDELTMLKKAQFERIKVQTPH
ncbi:MAG: hypothetical protein V4463_04595 [Pseudomonadota bacterium]